MTPPREFDEPGPRFTGDDQEAPLSAEDTAIKREFDEALAAEGMQRCLRCKERWFDVKLMADGVCKRCHDKDDKKRQDEPFFAIRREQARESLSTRLSAISLHQNLLPASPTWPFPG